MVVTEDAEVVALYYKDKKLLDSLRFNIRVNKATGKQITLNPEADSYYPGNGAFTLVDGILNEKGGRTNESLGFQRDVEAVIDLGETQRVSNVIVHALQSGGTYLYPPKSIEVYGSSDGKTFESLGNAVPVADNIGPKVATKVEFKPVTIRYIRLLLFNLPAVPAGERGAGEKTWMFLDEIQVN